MTENNMTYGFAQDIPGGFVFEIGNDFINRRIHCIAGRIGTTSLTHVNNSEEYLEQINSELEVELVGEGVTVHLETKDFVYQGYATPEWTDEHRILEILVQADVEDIHLPVSVFYEVRGGQAIMRKWLKIGPCDLSGWHIASVTIENLKLKEMVEGVSIKPRYTSQWQNNEDNVNQEPENVNIADSDQRFTYGDDARAIVTYWGYGEGLFFFMEDLLGEESFSRPTGLIMLQRDFAPVDQVFTTGAAVIGAYTGPSELGFKRYRDYLEENYLAVKGKKMPVVWNTWLITLAGGRSVMSDYDRQFIMNNMEKLKTAGFYDLLQMDLGWEAGIPLALDTDKFPNGLGEIARKAKEEAGMDLGFWINPFSSNYWRSDVEIENPQWLVSGSVSPRSGATAICPMSEHYDNVRTRLLELVTNFGAKLFYWDGNDWNIRDCKTKGHGHRSFDELKAKASRKLAAICADIHEANPEVIISLFNLPMNNHRLGVVDQEQISDSHSFPTVQSELIARQQIYQMAWEHPYQAIRSSWYGIGWHEAGEGDLSKRPFGEIKHALTSMIGKGLTEAGGSIDLNQAEPKLMNLLTKLFAFRKRFENYFDVYQHVLGFPGSVPVDGEGHVIDGKGFIVLINSTFESQTVLLPLSEPSLELASDVKYNLTDWTNLERGILFDSAKINDAPEIELAPLDVRYIGIEMRE